METAPSRDERPMRASFRRAGERLDCYRVWTDGPILRIDARGVWDSRVAEAYSNDIRQIVAELRTLRPHLRAIVDRSDAPVFGADVPERLMATYASVLRAGDRIAMVVDSSLVKGHIRRLADREETQTFLSISAAETWVLAYG